MISPEQRADQIRAFLSDLRDNRADEALTAGNDINALMKRRTINEGETPEGGTFGTYSDSYQRLREKKGYTDPPYPNVNFSFTNRMWDNIKPRVVEENENSVVIQIAPNQTFEIDKLRWNSERFGEIVDLNDDERQMLINAIATRYRNKLTEYGLI